MSFLDATAPQLAAAWGGGISNQDALDSFNSQFDPASVRAWLGRQYTPPRNEAEPSFFRFLVLTCAIAVNDIAGVDTKTSNFRTRLGRLLGVEEFQAVDGVNRLWKALEQWSERQRAAGRPVREIRLPDPGAMTLIGYAVRMAFPSRRDRAAFTNILRAIPGAVRRSPFRLVSELSRVHRTFELPAAIAQALEDFADRLAAGDKMLSFHRFWALVESVESALSLEEGKKRTVPRYIELCFSGYEQDHPEFRMYERRQGSSEEVLISEDPWASMATELVSINGSPIAEGVRHGYAVFNRSAGCWLCDESGIDTMSRCLIVARAADKSRFVRINTEWTPLDDTWEISGHVDGDRLAQVLEPTGAVIRELLRPTLAGGIRFKRGVYLGQPGFLPRIEQSDGGTVTISRLVGSAGQVDVHEAGTITTPEPVEGVWRISVRGSGESFDLPLTLEQFAPEPARFAEPPAPARWLLERELRTDSISTINVTALASNIPADLDTAQNDAICEAIFSKAGSSWRDGELVTLLKDVLPNQNLVWDVVRSFQECGWLDAYSSTTWRGRLWRCRPPVFVERSRAEAVVDGAIGNTMISRLRSHAEPMGILVRRIGKLSEFAPPTVVVSGEGISRLAASIDWPLEMLPGLPVSAPAAQWLDDRRSADGRFLADVWSSSIGLFLPQVTDTTNVVLERWVRERKDESDLFILRDATGVVKKTHSRAGAIAEAHRLNRIPLFSMEADRIVRVRKSGHIPLPIARQLRFRTGLGSGPTDLENGTWSYVYGIDAETNVWLRHFLGGALAEGRRRAFGLLEKSVEWRHRGGRRPVWNEKSFGSMQ